jgi:hypothetical protein
MCSKMGWSSASSSFSTRSGRRIAPWMWASSHNGDTRRAAHGYGPTREAAMAAFAKTRCRE